MLDILHELPQGLLDVDSTELCEVLDGPTLVHLEGRRHPALFVSALLHGNEPVGFDALKLLLGRYDVGGGDHGPLPRALSFLVGNPMAAASRARHLDSQPDFNRVWPGCETSGTPVHDMTRTVIEEMRCRGVFANIDVHNNTGVNPHYACVNVLDDRFFHLATVFNRTVVYFTLPRGVQSRAFADLCPSVTLECGKVGQEGGVEHAFEFLDACLHLSEIPTHPVADHDMELFHTTARVEIPPEVSFSYENLDADLHLEGDPGHWNFRQLPPGTALGRVRPGATVRLHVVDEKGGDAADDYFVLDGDILRTRVPVIPSMLTRDEEVIRQDCLCYFMERVPR